MTWKYEVGKQVVCIQDDWVTKGNNVIRFPKVGDILTVRDIDTHDVSFLRSPLLALRFEEIVNPVMDCPGYGSIETWYHAANFRPVRDTSIDCFKQLLVTPPTELERIIASQNMHSVKEKVHD